eukprot:g12996.t1
MPKSKRVRQVALTKVKKVDGKERKDGLIEKIQDAVDEYKHALVLTVENQRNELIKQIRLHFTKKGAAEKKGGRLFMGNNNVIKLALGNSPANEIADKIHYLGEKIQGECALLCSDMDPSEVQRFFTEFQKETFARGGTVATETYTIPQGELALPFSMEQHLRSLGLPTILKDGKIQMLSEHVVCREGKPITVDQAQILKLMGRQTAVFRMTPIAVWSKENGGSFKNINAA